jgi:hypothetical protein
MTTFTINTLPVEYANKIVCAFCSQYANESFCVSCNEYKSLMTLAEFMSLYEISEWVADEADELSAKLDSLIAKGVYA